MLYADLETSISCIRFPKSANIGTQERDRPIPNDIYPKVDPEDRIRKGMNDIIFMTKKRLFFHYKAIEVEGEKNAVDHCREIIAEGKLTFFKKTNISLDSTRFQVAASSMRII